MSNNSVLRQEIKIENIESYVPEGWERKLFKHKSGCLKGKHRISYISPFGREVRCKSQMEKYLAQLEGNDTPLSVDIEKFDFNANI